MVYVHTILRDVAGLFKVGRLVAYAQLNERHVLLLPLMRAGSTRARFSEYVTIQPNLCIRTGFSEGIGTRLTFQLAQPF